MKAKEVRSNVAPPSEGLTFYHQTYITLHAFKAMHCELCGREIRRGYIVLIEGAKLVACEDCAERGEILGVVGGQRSKRGKKQAEEDIEVLDIVEDFAKKIKKALEKKEMSIEELARKVHMSPEILKKILAGKYKPTVEEARKLEKILGIKLVEDAVVEKYSGSERSPELTLGDVVRLK